MEYLATFYTHLGAVKYHRYLHQKGIPVESVPVPRKFSSNCGIGVKFRTDEDLEQYISEDIEKIYSLNDQEGTLVYRSEW